MMGVGKERGHCSESLVLWSHHGGLAPKSTWPRKGHVNRINTIGATRDHMAFDHGCFDVVHDATLSLPLTAESLTHLRRPILLGSIVNVAT